MQPARFDAQLPEHHCALPPHLQRQLQPPPPASPAWRWLVRRAWDERQLRAWARSSNSRPFVKQLVGSADLDQSQWRISANLLPHLEAFLSRELHPQARPNEGGQQSLSFPLDGAHHLVCLERPQQILQLSPWKLRAEDLFPDKQHWQSHQGGLALISQPSITDSHRVSFPAAGTPEAPQRIKIPNPVQLPLPALKPLLKPLLNPWIVQGLPNATLVEFQSRHLGKILILELGSCGSGSVIQSHRPDEAVNRGQDKSWFRAGANWLITWFEPDALLPEDDIPVHTSQASTSINLNPPPSLRALRGQKLGMII